MIINNTQNYSYKIFIAIFALSVAVLPSAGIAQTSDTSVDADVQAELDDGTTSSQTDVQITELRIMLGESFALDSSVDPDNTNARSHTWTQTGGPFQFDMQNIDTNSITPQVAGTYEFELIAKDAPDEDDRVERRIRVHVVAATDQNGDTGDLPVTNEEGVPDAQRSEEAARLYQGLSVNGQICANSGNCYGYDRDDSTEASHHLRVRVTASEVRGWSEEQKTEVRERVQLVGETSSANDFGIKMASIALDNGSISEIYSDDEKTEVRYNTTIKLFGFIPVNTKATVHANAQGEAQVDYPWYAFLASKPDHSAMASFATQIRTSHDSLISVEE